MTLIMSVLNVLKQRGMINLSRPKITLRTPPLLSIKFFCDVRTIESGTPTLPYPTPGIDLIFTLRSSSLP